MKPELLLEYVIWHGLSAAYRVSGRIRPAERQGNCTNMPEFV